MKTSLFIATALILTLSACNNRLANLSPQYFRVNPAVLENVGGQVNAEITARFPAEYFDPKSTLAVTPVLVYDGGETKGEVALYQGEKVRGNERTIAFKTGGTATQRASFRYIEPMRQSELYLDFSATRGNKHYALPRVKVADGVLATTTLVRADRLTPAWGEDAFRRVIQEKEEASIRFLIQQSNIRESELRSQDITRLVQKLQEAAKASNREISRVDIHGYASPDGPQKLNERLAQEREQNAVSYINRELKRVKENPTVAARLTAEDWEGFRTLMEQSGIQDKTLILRVLSMYADPEEREREIRNIARTYPQVANDILPQLRRSRINLTVDVIGKSDSEILALLKSNPAKLNVEELLYAVELRKEEGSTPQQQLDLYKKIADLHPEDSRAYNNIGVLQFALDNYRDNESQAIDLFKQALAKQPNSPEANYNLGVIALRNNDLATAESYLGKATGVGEPLAEALGVYYIKKGNYAQADEAMQKAPNTNNAALAALLIGDYATAIERLDLVPEPDADTYYLKAIIAARSNNKEEVYKGLRAAILRDKTKAAYALKDAEFAKYLSDSEFLKIVK